MFVLKSEATHNTKSTEEAATPNYWAIALKDFSAGEPATTAIADVWAAMFPANLTLVAQIVGAIYADTYFVNTQMSADKLANDLSATLGKNIADCQRAAQTAFSQWYGLLVRSSPSDNGLIPRQDPVTSSPDVVVNGTTKTTLERLITMWNSSIWGPVSGDKNACYGRAASVNIQVPITKPVLRMFVTDAGLSNPPNQWTQLFTFPPESSATAALQDINGSSDLKPGTRSANASAFVWDVPGTGHYCLIATVGTEFFTNDPTLIPPGNWNSTTWIHYNGAAGWHNVDVLTASTAKLKIHNLDPTPEVFDIEASATRLPAGTEVSLEIADRKVKASSAVTRIQNGDEAIRMNGVTLPPNYEGHVVVTVKTPDGKPLPAGAALEVSGYWRVQPSHPNYQQAVELHEKTPASASQSPVRISTGSFTFIGRS